MDFNPEQKMAVEHKEGPLLVLAGPGTGKTAVIVGHVRYLIGQGVPPEQILVITFTRAAAAEMQERFLKEQKNGGKAAFGTFHSVFYHILKESGHYDENSVMSEQEKQVCLRDILLAREKELGFRELSGDPAENVRILLGEISFVKSNPTAEGRFESALCSKEQFQELFTSYEKEKKREGRLDFDDMIEECRKLLLTDEKVRKKWQERFRYVLIDEFQDVNEGQYETARILAAPENNLFAVGDDDQSIYGFRGAKPETMLCFRKDYPDAALVQLKINYRSCQEILNPAAKLIQNNQERYRKEGKCFRRDAGTVEACLFPDVVQELDYLAKQIHDYQKTGIKLKNMAVLYRSEAVVRPMRQFLLEQHIPCTGGKQSEFFYDQWLMKDLLCYLRLSCGQGSRDDLLQILNRPSRFMGRAALEEKITENRWTLEQDLVRLKNFYHNRSHVLKETEKLEKDLKRMGMMPPAAAASYLELAVGYRSFIRKYCLQHGIEEKWAERIWQEAAEQMKNYHRTDTFLASVEEAREEFQKKEKRKEDCLALITMHASKGLEYQIVFLTDLSEGVCPHGKAEKQSELEEERRLFYVALTRAKTHLHLYCTEKRYDHRPPVSRFFGEMGIRPEKKTG